MVPTRAIAAPAALAVSGSSVRHDLSLARRCTRKKAFRSPDIEAATPDRIIFLRADPLKDENSSDLSQLMRVPAARDQRFSKFFQ